MFNNLKTEGLEESQDRLGGFSVLDTDAYKFTIMAAYGHTADSGAKAVVLVLNNEGKEYREIVYVTNKAGENWFTQNDKKVPLPGFTTIDEICLVTTNKGLAEQTMEDKVMNVYDSEQKKELPKSVPMLVELIGQEVTLGVVRQKVNKQAKGDDGKYHNTDETREENTIEKVFHYPSNMTVPEARAGKTEPDFYPKWVEKNKGVTRDKTSKGDGKSGKPGSAPQAGSQQKPTSSLFGKQ